MTLTIGHPVFVIHQGEEVLAKVTQIHSETCVNAELGDGTELTSLTLAGREGLTTGEFYVQQPGEGAARRKAKREARGFTPPLVTQKGAPKPQFPSIGSAIHVFAYGRWRPGVVTEAHGEDCVNAVFWDDDQWTERTSLLHVSLGEVPTDGSWRWPPHVTDYESYLRSLSVEGDRIFSDAVARAADYTDKKAEELEQIALGQSVDPLRDKPDGLTYTGLGGEHPVQPTAGFPGVDVPKSVETEVGERATIRGFEDPSA